MRLRLWPTINAGAQLRRCLEPDEAHCKPIPVRSVFETIWRMERGAVRTFQGFQHRTIVLNQQAI
jgi:hypothetical protein